MATGVDPEYSVYVGNLNPSTTLSDMEDLIFELFLQVDCSVHAISLKIIAQLRNVFAGWSIG